MDKHKKILQKVNVSDEPAPLLLIWLLEKDAEMLKGMRSLFHSPFRPAPML
jgi:hypothetical protein